MTNYSKTTVQGILRDPDTNVLINSNTAEYERILEQRKQQKQAQTVQSQIDSLKNEFVELKEMLKQVLNGRA